MYSKSISVQHRDLLPFAIALTGVLMDAFTTMIGLSRGYVETHPNYSPVWALLIFWSVIAVSMIIPRTRFSRTFTLLVSIAPFLGAVNNSLVIIGAFQGLVI